MKTDPTAKSIMCVNNKQSLPENFLEVTKSLYLNNTKLNDLTQAQFLLKNSLHYLVELVIDVFKESI
jgi:hypothetical protein